MENLLHNDNPALFTSKEMGIPVTEFEELQVKIQLKLKHLYDAGKVIFIPGNTPSLKNQYEIINLYNTTSHCHSAKVFRVKDNFGTLRAYCSVCKKEVNLKVARMAHKPIIKDYLEKTEGYFLQNKVRFLNLTRGIYKPIILLFFYVRDSRRSFDYHNAHHIILDRFRDFHFIPDDDMNNVMAIPLGYIVDPKHPGVYIIVMSNQILSIIYDNL